MSEVHEQTILFFCANWMTTPYKKAVHKHSELIIVSNVACAVEYIFLT
jgi:hypothetical protein